MIVTLVDTIVSDTASQASRLAELRRRRNWSQAELARRVGVSRAGIGAIESGRVVPSVTTALRLAQALGCTVEELFAEPRLRWVGPPAGEGDRVWQAQGRLFRSEPTAAGELPHDGLVGEGRFRPRGPSDPRPTLVLAGCDPAVGLLCHALAERGVRVLPLHRSSRAALEALEQGLADVAGLHLGAANEQAVRETLGPGYLLVHLARWREGVAVAAPQPPALGPLLRGRATWAAREAGSGARLLLERLFLQEGRSARFRRLARDHRSVAQLVRDGWAQAGVCVELVAVEHKLAFLPVQVEPYDLCFAAQREQEPAVAALLSLLRDRSFRALLADLPGYDTAAMGEVRAVA
jgi:molybdate-binding protein/DNA-binding XRE family transcriptional regulator